MDVVPVRPNYDEPNYDENRIASYTLEDPLTFVNGTKVQNAADWARRRREILDIFAHEMFGEEPPKPETLIIEKFEEKNDALAGFAIRNQFKMYFKADKSGPCIHWLLYRPRYAKTPAPVITYLNYKGNQEVEYDTAIPLMQSWLRNNEFVENHHCTEAARGMTTKPNRDYVLPIGMLIARGFAVLTACYAEVSPDPVMDETDPAFKQEHFAYTGVFDLWGQRDETRDDNTTAIGAWAWALSRGLDLIEKIPELDAKKVVATGYSRLAKTALLAAARDERFAICVPNQCGGGGVTLAKRDYGENVATEVQYFTHWYCKAYRKYAKNPAQLLTFDQHLLLAAIAPRPVLVQGFGSPWFDAKGEFLSCQAASCAWEFFGKSALPAVPYPDEFDTSAIGEYLGFARRSENHGISAWDWMLTLDFARKHFEK